MASFAPLVARSGSGSSPEGARAASKQPDPKKSAVKPKLKVSNPSEPMERDADRAADRVMRDAPAFPMGAHSGTKKDDKAKRETKKDDKAKRETKKDDKAK